MTSAFSKRSEILMILVAFAAQNLIVSCKKGDIRVGMLTQNQPRSNWGIEIEILKEADLAGISNVSCSPVVAGGNKVSPSFTKRGKLNSSGSLWLS